MHVRETVDLPEQIAIPLAYTRIYAGEDGHSRFEDVDPAGRVSPVTESDLVAAFSETFQTSAATFRYVVREASQETRHNAPRRQFLVMLTGDCEVELSTGEKRAFGPGSVLLTEDLTGLGHTTRSLGDAPRLTLILPLGESGA